jgi:hypothetical protein
LKYYLEKKNWNEGKGIARPLNEELRQLNSYLEETRGKLARHYRELLMQEKEVTAENVKNAFIGLLRFALLHAACLCTRRAPPHRQKSQWLLIT